MPVASPELYQQRANQFQKETKEVERVISRYAWTRVVLIVIGIGVGYQGFSNSLFFYFVPVILFFFFFLVKRQLKQEERKQLLQNLVKLNLAEAKALGFEFAEFADGSRFADPHHPYSYDLDLFGKGSLYQYLNRSATQLGEERLAADLTHLNSDKETILSRQEAVRELGALLEFRQQVWALGKQINDFTFSLTPITKWLNDRPVIYRHQINTVLKWVLPAITLGVLALTITDSKYYPFLLLLMIIQLTITGVYAKQFKEMLTLLANVKSVLDNYSKVFNLLHEQAVSSALMKKHHAVAGKAAAEVKLFSGLVNSFESRMNPIAMMFGNGFFMYDFHSATKLEEWRERNAKDLPHWLESLAEWDALISLATLHFNQPSYVFGEITDELQIKGTEVGHPLISRPPRVSNDVHLGDPANVMLITGANMAGKSTFLRTIGINFVLAQAGAPVCASRWVSPIITLRSGMRTSDSLQDHQSYFYAELYRLQSIMEELRSGKRMLILLDEILKGTNSTDKQAGSRELIKQLKEQHALVLLATHDIALGDLEQEFPGQIINTCFEGRIEDGQLSFDYTLHYGVAQKANATFLMKRMGIIP